MTTADQSSLTEIRRIAANEGSAEFKKISGYTVIELLAIMDRPAQGLSESVAKLTEGERGAVDMARIYKDGLIFALVNIIDRLVAGKKP